MTSTLNSSLPPPLEFAMDILQRALLGEPGALSFLNRTSSIYLLDATDPTKPKTYGCWNFINQAMNELERYEATMMRMNNHNNQTTTTTTPHASTITITATLQVTLPLVQLLATLAQRVAQRSPASDKALVATCISNASQVYLNSKGSSSATSQLPHEAQALIQANHELREIVMGRIAVMVFDPTYHRPSPNSTTGSSHNNNNNNNNNYHHHHQMQQQPESAFANPMAMESFCAVLAANAVSSGPNAMNHFVTEWIVPSVPTLPPFAVVCVTLHVAEEAMRTPSAPAGSRDMLQRLVSLILTHVLGPILADAILESNPETSNSSSGSNGSGSSGGGGSSSHTLNQRIAAIALRALERWCLVTGLSLGQVKSICHEVKINVVSVLSDSMYSDSPLVIEALAELLESATAHDDAAKSTPSATSPFNVHPLAGILPLNGQVNGESQSVLDELVAAIGLQRFRFVERQANGDHEVCRNLTRIAATICKSRLQYIASNRQNTSGIVDLLVKAAAHPSVNICGITLEVIPSLIQIEPSLAPQILPILQRRAIIPHRVLPGSNTLVLAALEMCGVNVLEFQKFRDHVLTDALTACWMVNANNFVDSCTLAIEEFCGPNVSASLSFQLEAALFCVSVAAENNNLYNNNNNSVHTHSKQLERCTLALARKPTSVWENPCTIGQMCKFLRQYVRWFCEGPMNGALDVAMELAMAAFQQSASPFADDVAARAIIHETAMSPFSEAALTMHALLSLKPSHFVSNEAIAALGATWEASYAACNRADTLSLEDRTVLCSGICKVLSIVPENQRAMSFHALALPPSDCLRRMVEMANTLNNPMEDDARLLSILARSSDEIQILTVMATTFSQSARDANGNQSSMESGCRTAPDRLEPIKDPAFAVIRRAWPNVVQLTSKYSWNESISEALAFLLVECIPADCVDDSGLNLFKELCGIANTILSQECKNVNCCQPIFAFVKATLEAFGESINKSWQERLEGLASSSERDYFDDVGKCLEELILRTIATVRSFLGSTWSRSNEQNQGQPAFESRTSPAPEERPLSSSSSEALHAIFSMLTACATHCPVFLVNLPITLSSDREDGTLFNQAVESAVPCLGDADIETSSNAIHYVLALVKLCGVSSTENVRVIVSDSIMRVRPSVVKLLVVGSCGRFNRATLKDVSILLHALLSSVRENGSNKGLIAALRNDNFIAGDAARTVAIKFLSECTTGAVPVERLGSFLDDLWLLHQTDNAEAVVHSDSALNFVRKYGDTTATQMM